MKYLFVFSTAFLVLYLTSCANNAKTNMQQQQQITEELTQITRLLRDSSFALNMAKNQEAAYYKAQGEPAPEFLPENGEAGTVEKSIRDEKIATSIAAFYALECAVGALMEQEGGTPLEWLNKIKTNQLDSSGVLLVNRFANATWKAGQPFRGLERITREVFVSPVFLPEAEVKKDYDQVSAAAEKLTEAMRDVKDASKENQLQKLKALLQDKSFALEMAQHMEAAYYTAQQQEAPVFLKPGEDTATITKSLKEEKVATNIAGFYALECGLSYLATAQQKLPSVVLQAIVNDSLDAKNKKLFERFANATWKAGQPFRGLDRITREVFIPFDLLSKEAQEKDWVQVKAAAEKLLQSL
ncbi:hypothetical protein [Agriterribacter sp.]|uniref:hypothetical protein n=1 Tax=Agriterribacter sp. TaxID=2821509 RepID=UPI002D0850CC|nr:hypothetical protein [Agriterribacter sp.]HRO45559.1 hypothetical protein [Agriterribacter sp.]HRQ17245.1 hypothetical protein [Agriterribacter sp.]